MQKCTGCAVFSCAELIVRSGSGWAFHSPGTALLWITDAFYHDMKRKWGKDEMIHENNVKKMKYFMFFVYKS
jgi:hypothetical protein